MRSRVREYAKELTFRCPYCGQPFSASSSQALQGHVKRHHQGEYDFYRSLLAMVEADYDHYLLIKNATKKSSV